MPKAQRRFFGSVSALAVSVSSAKLFGSGDSPASSNRSCRMKLYEPTAPRGIGMP